MPAFDPAGHAQTMPQSVVHNVWTVLHTVHGDYFTAHVDTFELVRHPQRPMVWALRVYLDDGCIADYLLDGADPRCRFTESPKPDQFPS